MARSRALAASVAGTEGRDIVTMSVGTEVTAPAFMVAAPAFMVTAPAFMVTAPVVVKATEATILELEASESGGRSDFSRSSSIWTTPR